MADYDSTQAKIHEAVDKLIKAYPQAEILVTGHSMGAALSVIFGIEFKLKYDNKVV
jgi:putative lipase involved disintegration of autophagic bodies